MKCIRFAPDSAFVAEKTSGNSVKPIDNPAWSELGWRRLHSTATYVRVVTQELWGVRPM